MTDTPSDATTILVVDDDPAVRQFSADALSHVAFTGALAALAIGVDARIGLFAATIAVAVVIGLSGRGGRTDDVVIGTIFTGVLGVGVLCLSIYTRSGSGANGAANVNVLFGSIFTPRK